MNYYYDPTVAAKLAAWVNYICPGRRAPRRRWRRSTVDLVDNPLIFPDDETLAKTFGFMPLDEQQITEYEGDFADVTGG